MVDIVLSLGDEYLVEVFLKELGFHNVNKQQILMPEYLIKNQAVEITIL